MTLWTELSDAVRPPDLYSSSSSSSSNQMRSEEAERESVVRGDSDTRTHAVIQCANDNSCNRQEFCHGGEGHKICLQCRRQRRRCHRDGMCCNGHECRRGVCRSRDSRGSYERHVSSEESISQNTKDDINRAHEGATCRHENDCMTGLCCANHFWAKICKRILDEDDVCTKDNKRQRLPSFDRCPCQDGLVCKREPSGQTRLHTCQRKKHRT
ncbi:dickkopf-related protein 1-like [Glandiceps talaboti]